MDQEERWIVRRYMRDGACLRHVIFAEPDALHHFDIRVGEFAGEVHHACHRDDCLHAAGLVKVFPHIPTNACIRRAKQPHKVPTRAHTDRADPVRIEIVLRGVRSQRADRALHILDHRRELRGRIQTIIQRNHEIAPRSHDPGEHPRFGFIAVHPGPAVHIDQDRPGSARRREVNIHGLRRVIR